MKTSILMEELRKIRDENSIRHLSQTPNEFSAEMLESVNWFVEELGKPIKSVNPSKYPFI